LVFGKGCFLDTNARRPIRMDELCYAKMSSGSTCANTRPCKFHSRRRKCRDCGIFMDFSTIRTGITPVDFKFVDVCPRCGQMKELKEAEKDG
jgi:hypothetical protein